ncbi:hypothetical protein MW887_007489 [Aspergillus wentii]|nr:hypothetical protein MW887_007489 [Aspergillus wentii]
MHRHHRHSARHATHAPPRRPEVVPRNRIPTLVPSDGPTLIPSDIPTLVRRSDTTTTCGSGSSDCEKPTSTTSTTTLPVVLGAVVPIVCAIVVLIYLHRRNVRKLRNEDANDKHKSLDFGMDIVDPKSGSRPMQQTERSNHMKGVSLDIGHPYLLPPGLHDSRDSLHSMSRSIGEDNKLRHQNPFVSNDSMSVRSQQRGFHDDTASLAGSSRFALGDDMNAGLLGNAQRVSRSSPPIYTPPAERNVSNPAEKKQEPYAGLQLDLPRSISPSFASAVSGNDERHSAASRASTDVTEFRRDNDHFESELHRDSLSPEPLSPSKHRQSGPSFPLQDHSLSHPESHPDPTQTSSIPTPRISLPLSDAASDYGDARQSMVPAVNIHGVEDTHDHDETPSHVATIPIPEEPPHEPTRTLDPRRDTRRMTLGLRPLPPEDPSDNPEQRANRIRSFYKEYFEETKAGGGRETIYEDYGPEYYPDGYFDPATGDYYSDVPLPFAEPVNRRAMTPPPRAPPRFQGAGHMANNSVSGLSGFSSPRAFSSASNHLPPPRAPRKPMPPPAPLNVLPSPHLLKDDAFMNAADYAPGKNFKDQREGRPETPLGGVQPFSPMARAHTPLASAFDDLSIMPSPHALRKSGAYSNLDFAPPPRFKNTETASDSGSIRSVGTGISTTHLNNIRTGAYRVSRLPADTVGTKDDLMASLRPAWDMRK